MSKDNLERALRKKRIYGESPTRSLCAELKGWALRPLQSLSQECTQSSLLIPEKFLEDFPERTENLSREDYFHSLLKRSALTS